MIPPTRDEIPLEGATGGMAPLQNVALPMRALERSLHRAEHLPGIVAFTGPSGWGKSWGAAYTANKLKAYYVEADETWTRKALLRNILIQIYGKTEANIFVKRETVSELLDRVAEQLALSRRPLIIDQFDDLVSSRLVDLVRAIADKSTAAVLIIGEEGLPDKLKVFERFHGRVLDWILAAPADFNDGKRLRDFYGVQQPVIQDDLVSRIVQMAAGSVRRICVNLDRCMETAREQGLKSMGLADWGDRPLYTGDAPRRKV